ncbi:hypothetical protein LMG27174_06468 [Paraburkholderia rhynchosiae]|uniref:Uncharacterized protein n=1 Tax=Paraburkholderia rhynchosiae TaxID=487049 RepID=A0A6J5CL79_9BURK|nr:hypothetical protein LMG27174_06468 [Paraburkholderia rhynchosiae]
MWLTIEMVSTMCFTEKHAWGKDGWAGNGFAGLINGRSVRSDLSVGKASG